MSTPAQQLQVEPQNFRIYFADGTEQEYLSDEENQYHWSTDMAGTLFVYRKKLHIQFSAVIKDERIRAVARGGWSKVETIEVEDARH